MTALPSKINDENHEVIFIRTTNDRWAVEHEA